MRASQSPGLTAARAAEAWTRADRLLLPRTLKADFKISLYSYTALSFTVRLRRHIADLPYHCLRYEVGPAVLLGVPPTPPGSSRRRGRSVCRMLPPPVQPAAWEPASRSAPPLRSQGTERGGGARPGAGRGSRGGEAGDPIAPGGTLGLRGTACLKLGVNPAVDVSSLSVERVRSPLAEGALLRARDAQGCWRPRSALLSRHPRLRVLLSALVPVLCHLPVPSAEPHRCAVR